MEASRGRRLSWEPAEVGGHHVGLVLSSVHWGNSLDSCFQKTEGQRNGMHTGDGPHT